MSTRTNSFRRAALGLLALNGRTLALGPAPVVLGTAANYAVLAKSAVSTVPNSLINGDIGLSPAAGSFLTGFALTQSATNQFSSSTQVTGSLFAADYTIPTPSLLTSAVSDMETAYTDASTRSNPDFSNLGAGDISGLTLTPGLYKWTSGLTVPTDITIAGTALDTWIFQISGVLSLASSVNVILSGGALVQNIVWAVAGSVDIGTNAHFEGVLLTATDVTLKTGASMNGRILSQTQVALQMAIINQSGAGSQTSSTLSPSSTVSTISSSSTISTISSSSTISTTSSSTSTVATVTTCTTTATVTAPTTTATEPASQCNTGNAQCCKAVQSASSASTLLALLGVVIQNLSVLIGVTCTPISAIGIGSNSCTAQPVCCTNNNFNGVIAIGCTPINLNL